MKNFNLFAVLVLLTLVFTSCSFNETVLPEEQSTDLLKTHTIKRDVDGTYSLDYSLNANAATENVIDESTNTNYIYLYPSENKLSSKVTQDFTIDGNQLKIGFVDTNSSKKSQITIKDEDAKFFKTESEDMLSEYSISGNENGTYTLNFSVKNKVKVDFVFNEELNIYEVHLEEGKSDESVFSKVFEKIEGEALKIDFVNHIREDNTSAKSSSEDDGYVFKKERRPEVIII
ncbi:hypothetical protein [Polaribacter sp. AHE13PA]|uniref:hypothetical protein n=1 Tax=Polaribacter sp. AHE13PA TaxID=2745562 RepID=UPI001C4F9F79|nr:hypothetical protein [Polaribacter sp. AHE13PA]QXP66874.1 hypothetical protein H0I28_17250 [Polaribacter sp. AHE13PA]